MKKSLKAAFITGAGSGIGRALAHALVARGTAVFLADINGESLAKVEEELKLLGATVASHILDVADKDAVFAAAAKAEDEIGPIDIVFNNAGVALTDTIEKMEYSDFEWVMNINFWGVVHGSKAFLDGMKKRGNGYIVNISSLFGLIGLPGQGAYCAAKHAVKAFNESLYYELQGTGVQVHSVHPGGVDTGIVTNGVHKNGLNGVAKSADMQNKFSKLAITTPEGAAATILNGVDNDEFRIIVGKDARRLDRLNRWIPGLLRKNIAKRIRNGGGDIF